MLQLLEQEERRHQEALNEIMEARRKGQRMEKYEGSKGLVTYINLDDIEAGLPDEDTEPSTGIYPDQLELVEDHADESPEDASLLFRKLLQSN